MTRKRWNRPVAALVVALLVGGCAGSVETEDVADGGVATSDTQPEAAAPGVTDPGADTALPAAPTATEADPATPTAPGGPGTPATAGTAKPAPATASGAKPATASGSGAAAPAGGQSAASGTPASGGNAPAPKAGSAAPPPPAPDPKPGAAPAPAPAPAGTGPGSMVAAENGIIKVGMVYPLSGPLGPNGRSMAEAFQSVLSKINDEGGFGGAKVKFLVRDDQFDPSQSKRHIRELLNEKIWAFSGFTPALWLAAKDDLLAAGVLGFPFDVGAERQREVRTSFAPYQNCIRVQAGNVVEAIRRGQKKLAFLELDIEAVHHCMDYSAELAKKLGGEVVFRGRVAPGAPDCGPQVLAARGADPDALLPFIEVLGTIKCVQSVRQQGWDVPIQIGWNISGDTAFIDALKAGAEGITSVSPYTGMPGYPGWENNCGVVRRYYPKHVASLYSSIGCSAGLVLGEVLKAVGPTATRDQAIQWLETHPISTNGLSPDIVYKPGDHRPFDSVMAVAVKDGKWVQTGEPYTPDRLSEDITDGE